MRLLELVTVGLEILAALALFAMVGLIVADVALGVLLGIHIFGAYELAGIFMAPVAFLPMARTLLKGQHLTVELIDNVVSEGSLGVFRLIGLACTFTFAAMLAVLIYGPMMDTIRFGEVTLDLGLPIAVKIAPIFVGMCAAAVSAGYLFVAELRSFARRGGA